MVDTDSYISNKNDIFGKYLLFSTSVWQSDDEGGVPHVQDLRQGSVAAVQESEEAREDAQHLIRKLLRCLHQRRKGNFSFIMF